MLDIQFIRDNRNLVKQTAINKGVPDKVDELLAVDEKRRTLIKQTEEIRRQRNDLMKGVFGKPTQEIIDQGKALKDQSATLEPQLKEIEIQFNELMLQIPNMPDKDVPIGKDSSGNVEIAKWGGIPQFDFEK